MTQTVHILGEGGAIFQMTLPLGEGIAGRLDKGYLKRVNADGTPWRESEPTQPAPYAPKSAWVGWAVTQSEASGDPLTPDDAEAMTKQELIELFGTR